MTLLRKKYRELTRTEFFIINSSLNHFSLVSFVKLSWQRYLDILWYAVEIGLEHYGHAFYSTRKEYAVLRTGAKDGIVPQIVYSVGETVACKKCMEEFVESVGQWRNEQPTIRSNCLNAELKRRDSVNQRSTRVIARLPKP